MDKIDKDTEQYLRDTFRLAKTLVIKSLDSVDFINRQIELTYPAYSSSTSNVNNWKYYKNICGEYHFSDEMMQVISVDTLKPIEFTVDNLKFHIDTKKAYQYGTQYYYVLLDKYPKQEQLILGILNPCDKELAINSENGTILNYDKTLVESQEQTLLLELESWIKLFNFRWHNRAFNHSDDLYALAQHAILYLNLVPKILNLRLKRCKTNEVHSYHIKKYLSSHHRLDKYIEYMTLKQKLFLYRNIKYIQRNVGKNHILQWLIRKFFTDRQLPIAEYKIKYIDDFEYDFTPKYRFRKVPINTQYNTPSKDHFTLDELLEKEKPLTTYNPTYSDGKKTSIKKNIGISLSSIVQTKDLESSLIDYTGSDPNGLNNIIVNHWAYFSSKGLYEGGVKFTNPKDDASKVLPPDKAFLFYSYVHLKSMGVKPTVIPLFLVKRVVRITKPSVNELMVVNDKKILTDNSVATAIINNQPEIKHMPSRTMFYGMCVKIKEASDKEWFLHSNTHEVYRRAIVSNMINRMYTDAFVSFNDTGKNWATWLIDNNLPDYDYTETEKNKLLQNILEGAVSDEYLNSRNLRDIQEAMVGIITALTSYSIQFIREANYIPLLPVSNSIIRVEPYTSKIGEILIQNIIETKLCVDVIELWGSALHEINIPYKYIDIIIDKFHITDTFNIYLNGNMDSTSNISVGNTSYIDIYDQSTVREYRVLIHNMYFMVENTNNELVPGLQEYNSSPHPKVDVYHNNIVHRIITDVQYLENVIVDTELKYYEVLVIPNTSLD